MPTEFKDNRRNVENQGQGGLYRASVAAAILMEGALRRRGAAPLSLGKGEACTLQSLFAARRATGETGAKAVADPMAAKATKAERAK